MVALFYLPIGKYVNDFEQTKMITDHMAQLSSSSISQIRNFLILNY